MQVYMPEFVNKLFNRTPISTIIADNDRLRRQLKKAVTKIQGATDITTNTSTATDQYYTGTPTPYNTYAKQVKQLSLLYDNTAPWGCMIAKNVIDMRTAFTMGSGIKVIKRETFKGNAEKEISWVKEFMRFNNLDEEMPQEYAKEAEIEGKVLFRFLVDEEKKQIRLVHVPWRSYGYTISTPPYDYYNYNNAVYDGSGDKSIDFNLASELFVYKRFGGNASAINISPPKTAYVLREMGDIDKAFWDWRHINQLFAAPTPTVTCEDPATAKILNTWFEENNWTIGKLLVLGGANIKFNLIGWEGDGYTTVKEETQALIKTISGTTGIPVHFLGYPELLSNRDTAESLIATIELSTSKERNTWIGGYEEIFQKAMVIYNTYFDTFLNPMAIDAELEEVSLATLEEPKNAPVSKGTNTSPE